MSISLPLAKAGLQAFYLGVDPGLNGCSGAQLVKEASSGLAAYIQSSEAAMRASSDLSGRHEALAIVAGLDF